MFKFSDILQFDNTVIQVVNRNSHLARRECSQVIGRVDGEQVAAFCGILPDRQIGVARFNRHQHLAIRKELDLHHLIIVVAGGRDELNIRWLNTMAASKG